LEYKILEDVRKLEHKIIKDLSITKNITKYNAFLDKDPKQIEKELFDKFDILNLVKNKNENNKVTPGVYMRSQK